MDMNHTDDVIDVRDVIERVEELEGEEQLEEDEREELATLVALLDQLCGNGGDHQWKGDWYPVTLIHEDHFEDYAQELAEDIGAVDRDAAWPGSFIDWEAAADALRMDYFSVDFAGETYWTR